MKKPVWDTRIPTRVIHALTKAGWENPQQLEESSPDRIAKARNIGKKSVDLLVEIYDLSEKKSKRYELKGKIEMLKLRKINLYKELDNLELELLKLENNK